MIIFMNIYKTKGVLGSWKLWFSYIYEKKNQNQNFGSFSADFRFRAEGKKVTSRAELKILQLGTDSSLLGYCLIIVLLFSLLLKKVSKKIYQKCPREFTQKISTRIHPKRGLLVDKSPKVSTRIHLFCRRNVTFYVHEKSATPKN
jgi:hypothetical protein